MDQHDCPPGPHRHLITRPASIFGAWAIVGADVPGLLVVTDPVVADRVIELIDRHGLVDVPLAAMPPLNTWPAPAGPRYLAPRPGAPVRPARVQP